jgi:RING finger protein 170
VSLSVAMMSLQILDLIRDLPVIIPYLFSRLFTAQGFIWMFQARVALCFIGLALYVLSPFDIIPEAIFGVFGLFDDLLVAFGLLLYATVIYRNFVANQ